MRKAIQIHNGTDIPMIESRYPVSKAQTLTVRLAIHPTTLTAGFPSPFPSHAPFKILLSPDEIHGIVSLHLLFHRKLGAGCCAQPPLPHGAHRVDTGAGGARPTFGAKTPRPPTTHPSPS